MGYGEAEGGGYNEATLLFKADPSIANYVKLRRERPDEEIEIRVHGGIDQLFFMEPVLERFGIRPEQMAGVLDADPRQISAISLHLLADMAAVKSRRKSGETHSVRRGRSIPTKLVDWFINCALDALSWNDQFEVPRDLIVLIRERLGGPKSDYEKAALTHERKQAAAIYAGRLLAMGRKPSMRQIARAMRVAPSTVKRWFEPGELQIKASSYQSWFDTNGTFQSPLEAALRAKGRAQQSTPVQDVTRAKRRPRSPRKPA